MLLTVSKRFEFSSSHRYFIKSLSEPENYKLFGDKSKGNYGHGHNYVVYFQFTGAIDHKTGMVINVADIKNAVLPLLEKKYDHKFLNLDTKPFDKILPTPENLSIALFNDVADLFKNSNIKLHACRLDETGQCSTKTFSAGQIERTLKLDFSAARRTCSPHLTDKENEQLFGVASSPTGHGHHYQTYITLTDKFDEQKGMVVPDVESEPVLQRLFDELDHRNLNLEVKALSALPVTTEIISRYIFDRLKKELPVTKIRLLENENFFVEYDNNNNFRMGVKQSFYSAHRLNSSELSENENLSLYGKCNNLHGHGHQYFVECVVDGNIDERTGTIGDLVGLNNKLKLVLDDWNYRHLDLETDDFKNLPTTGENIVSVLWEKLEKSINNLYQIKLWETPNNCFTLKK